MDKPRRITLSDRECTILSQALFRQMDASVTAIELLALREKLSTGKPQEPKVRRRRRTADEMTEARANASH